MSDTEHTLAALQLQVTLLEQRYKEAVNMTNNLLHDRQVIACNLIQLGLGLKPNGIIFRIDHDQA